MFYPTLYLKMGAYLQDVFELNTADHKLLGFTIPHLVAFEIAQTRFLAKQIDILFTHFWIIIIIRGYFAWFCLRSS